MSIRAKSRMSVSYQPADLTTTTNTIFEEKEPTGWPDGQFGRRGSEDQHDQQEQLIIKLRQRITDLEIDAEASVSFSDHQRVQQEWQTSEDLLRDSQRDNEQKHETIEQYKLYVKDLERIIDETLGHNWKMEQQIRPPLSQSTCFSASTPLPKPSQSALRRSVSVLPSAKRSSKIAARHVSASHFGSINAGSLVLVKDVAEMDDTPTGAMRKLLGSSARPHQPIKMTERAAKVADSSALNPQTASPCKSAALPLAAVTDSSPISPAKSVPPLDSEQVTALLKMLSATTATDSGVKVQNDPILLQTLQRIERAEKAAGERETRLRTMLEEVGSSMIPADMSGKGVIEGGEVGQT